jgi:hypothetical protein
VNAPLRVPTSTRTPLMLSSFRFVLGSPIRPSAEPKLIGPCSTARPTTVLLCRYDERAWPASTTTSKPRARGHNCGGLCRARGRLDGVPWQRRRTDDGVSVATIGAGERILELLDRPAMTGPRTLILEDLQCVDVPGLLLWNRLTRVVDQIPLSLLGTCRPVPSRQTIDRLRAAVRDPNGLSGGRRSTHARDPAAVLLSHAH